MQAAHHLLLAHGLAVPLLRERSAPEAEVGISLSLSLCNPATDSTADKAAAERGTLFFNNWFLHPLFKGEYPAEMVPLLDMLGIKREPEDAAVIATPIDFLGVNYYIRHLVTEGTEHPPLNISFVTNPDAEYTEMPWEVYPKGIRELLENVQRDYRPRKIYITENGAAFNDTVEDGKVHDANRVEYLRGYLAEINQAIANGVPVKGYFVWSLMDNFEWAYGFSKRFGVIYVDFETQQRIIKDSGLFYQSAIAANGFEVSE
jgi:beta-glucosidase